MKIASMPQQPFAKVPTPHFARLQLILTFQLNLLQASMHSRLNFKEPTPLMIFFECPTDIVSSQPKPTARLMLDKRNKNFKLSNRLQTVLFKMSQHAPQMNKR